MNCDERSAREIVTHALFGFFMQLASVHIRNMHLYRKDRTMDVGVKHRGHTRREG
jgi:hypothetical protein